MCAPHSTINLKYLYFFRFLLCQNGQLTHQPKSKPPPSLNKMLYIGNWKVFQMPAADFAHHLGSIQLRFADPHKNFVRQISDVARANVIFMSLHLF